MKKTLFLFVIAIMAFFTNGCKKDKAVTPEALVIFTHDPPKDIWPTEQQYKQTFKVYLQTEDLKSELNRGRQCINWGQLQCQDYYTIDVRSYYGLYNGKLYVEESKKSMVIGAAELLQVEKEVNKKGSVILQLCVNCNGVPFSDLGDFYNGIDYP